MSLCFTTGDHNFIHRASTSSVTATTREANPYPVLVKELVHVSGNGPEEDSSCGDTRPSSLMDHSTRGRSEWDLPFKKVDPEVNRWRHMTGSQWKWTLPEVEKKSHPPRRVASWSRHCNLHKFVNVWGSIIFNCFCLVFEPLLDHSCWFFCGGACLCSEVSISYLVWV